MFCILWIDHSLPLSLSLASFLSFYLFLCDFFLSHMCLSLSIFIPLFSICHYVFLFLTLSISVCVCLYIYFYIYPLILYLSSLSPFSPSVTHYISFDFCLSLSLFLCYSFFLKPLSLSIFLCLFLSFCFFLFINLYLSHYPSSYRTFFSFSLALYLCRSDFFSCTVPLFPFLHVRF